MTDLEKRLESIKRKISEAEKVKLKAEAVKEEAEFKIKSIRDRLLSEFQVSTAQEVKDLLQAKTEEIERLLAEAEIELEGLNV